MTPLGRALRALERMNAKAAHPDRQRDPSEPRVGGVEGTDGDAGTHGGYDATERAWWGAGPEDERHWAVPDVVLTVTPDSSGFDEAMERLRATPRASGKVFENAVPDTRTGDCPSAAHRSLLVKQRGEIERLTADVHDLQRVLNRERELPDAETARLAADLLAKDAERVVIGLRIYTLEGEVKDNVAEIERLTASLDKARTEVTQLAVELVAKDDTIEHLATELTSSMARCERLWTQLQEAANVPDVSGIPWERA